MASGSGSAVSASNTEVTPTVRFDPTFLKDIPGWLKVAECVFSLVGFICVQTIYISAYLSAGGWFAFVSMSGFWITLFLIIFYLFHIVEKFHWLPWLVAETGFAAIWSAFFFIAACVAAANAKNDPGWGAAAFFGFAAMIVFGYEAFTKYLKWRAGDVAQGEKTTTTTNSSNTVPTGPSYPTY